jgi:hypothetical protein
MVDVVTEVAHDFVVATMADTCFALRVAFAISSYTLYNRTSGVEFARPVDVQLDLTIFEQRWFTTSSTFSTMAGFVPHNLIAIHTRL